MSCVIPEIQNCKEETQLKAVGNSWMKLGSNSEKLRNCGKWKETKANSI